MMTRIVLLIVLIGGMYGAGFTQERPNAVKLGWEANSASYGWLPVLSFEKALQGGRVALQGDLGWKLRRPRSWNGSIFNDNHLKLGISVRTYFALRQGQLLSGAYFAPYFDYNRRIGKISGAPFKSFDDHTYSAGIGLGYQHAFFSRLRVDGGIRFMYIIETEHESYRSDGTVQYYQKSGSGFGGGLYLKVGYAF